LVREEKDIDKKIEIRNRINIIQKELFEQKSYLEQLEQEK
jgi:hypothetical protein